MDLEYLGLKKWQKLVAEDDSEEVMVLKGRRVGATSFIPYLCQDCNSLYVARNHRLMEGSLDRYIRYIEEDPILNICDYKSSPAMEKNYIEFIKGRDKHNIIHFITRYNIVDVMRDKNIDKVVFDEVSKYDIDSNKINKIKERVEQIYYFVSPSLIEGSLYVVPSVSNTTEEKNISEFKEIISPEIFREEMLAGVVFGSTLSEQETNMFIPKAVPEKQVNSDEVEEFIEYKGRKYKLVDD